MQGYLFLPDPTVIKLTMAVHIANMDPYSDPVWLLIMGPPSTAKTEILRSMFDHSTTYTIGSLTGKTLFAGKAPQKRGGNPSLIYQLENRTILMPDFTSILSLPHNDRNLVMDHLRTIYDGRRSFACGTGETFTWEGKVGFIGATTPIFERHRSVIAELGDRFVIWREIAGNPMDVAEKALTGAGMEVQYRHEIRAAMHTALNWLLPKLKFCPLISIVIPFERDIVRLSVLIAKLKTPVPRDSRGHMAYSPESEGPARFGKQLKNIARGLLFLGESVESARDIIIRIAFTSLPVNRLTLIRYMFDAIETQKQFTNLMLSDSLRIPASTINRLLKDLWHIDVVQQIRDGNGSLWYNLHPMIAAALKEFWG
jgi:hypothetical protein